MATQIDSLSRSFLAGEALEAYRRVKLDSTVDQVVYADAGDDFIGVTQAEAASGDHVEVMLKNSAATLKIESAGAFTYKDVVYGAADGKIDDNPVGLEVGLAGASASGSGSIIEIFVSSGGGISEAAGDTIEATGGSGGIAALDLVYVSDQTDNVMTVLKALGTSSGRFADFICPNAIAAAGVGLARKMFLLSGLNTSAGAIGDPVYLSDTTAGGYILTKPTTTDKVQIIGRIVEDHASTGAILFDLSGPQQIVHTHETNAEGGQLVDLDAIATATGIAEAGDLGAVSYASTSIAGTGKKIPRNDHQHKLDNVVAGAEGAVLAVYRNVPSASGGGDTALFTTSRKIRPLLWWVIARDTDAANVKLKHGSTDFTGVTAKGAADDAVVMGASILAAQDEIASGVVISANLSAAGEVDVVLLYQPIA